MTYFNPDALVSTDWLNRNLDDPSLRIIEVDEDTAKWSLVALERMLEVR